MSLSCRLFDQRKPMRRRLSMKTVGRERERKTERKERQRGQRDLLPGA